MASSHSLNLKDFKALSFDIYGTLIDWETGIYTALHSSPLGSKLPQNRKALLQQFERYEREVQQEHPKMLYANVLAAAYTRLAQKLGTDEDAQAAEVLGKSVGKWPAFPDTVAAIQGLGKHYKLIPLSNVDRKSFQRTLDGPLAGCNFDAIYTAQDIGSYKPDIRNFHYLLEHVKEDFEVEKAQLLHVAQSLYHDHVPAKKVDLTSVWVDRKGAMGDAAKDDEDVGYQLRVGSLGELAELVEKAWRD